MHFTLFRTHLCALLQAATTLVALVHLAPLHAQTPPVGSVRQDRKPTLQASQASTPVPPVAYRSVFDDLPKGVEPTVLDWKTSNAKVSRAKPAAPGDKP